MSTTAPARERTEQHDDVAEPDVPWTITPVAGGYEVTLDLDEPLPVVDDAPTLVADGVDLGPATESGDGLSLSLVTTDDAVVSADDIELGWASGDDAKVELTDAGREMLARADVIADAVVAEILRSLSGEEREALHGTLRRAMAGDVVAA